MCLHTDNSRRTAQNALAEARNPPPHIKGTPGDFSGFDVMIMVCADCGQPVELRRSLHLDGGLSKLRPVQFVRPA